MTNPLMNTYNDELKRIIELSNKPLEDIKAATRLEQQQQPQRPAQMMRDLMELLRSIGIDLGNESVPKDFDAQLINLVSEVLYRTEVTPDNAVITTYEMAVVAMSIASGLIGPKVQEFLRASMPSRAEYLEAHQTIQNIN